jgi:nitric oxide reductase NorD protein
MNDRSLARPDNESLDEQLNEHLKSVKTPAERRTVAKLLREIRSLPLEHTVAAVEVSATIAAVSLRASIEFLRMTPDAARVLEPAELRAWGELGRRLTTNDVESGISFFSGGTADFARVPAPVRPFVFQVCSRQMILSAAIAAETFRNAPALADAVADAELLRSIYEIAASISRRSAKHSAEFLSATPAVVARLREIERRDPPANAGGTDLITSATIDLIKSFAEHAGGIAADAWVSIPPATARLDPDNALKLIRRARSFLERGGGAALQVLIAGGDILRTIPECFDEWIELLWAVAAHGNAGLVAFTRTCPTAFQLIVTETRHELAVDLVRRVISLTRDVARVDGESALACLRSSAKALRTVSIDQFESWARAGLITSDTRTRRSYYALETRTSNNALRASDHGGVTLESIQHLLRLYVEGLTGRAVEIASVAAVPVEARIGDGSTIYLPAAVSDFGDDELDFRLYKVLAAHAAGQIEFGTYEQGTDDLRAAYASLAARFDPANQDERAAFADDGYLPQVEVAQVANLRSRDETNTQVANFRSGDETKTQVNNLRYSDVLSLFPIPALARRIFGTLENGRIDRRLRRQYRGLNRDLDLIRAHLRSRRPKIIDLPATLVPFELLFQITMLGGALDDARDFYRQIVSELETVVADYLNDLNAMVADTLMATGRVYDLFQSISMEDSEKQIEVPDEQDQEDASKLAEEMLAQRERDRQPQRRDARELFNAWNTEAEGEFDELEGSEAWSEGETPEHGLEEGEVAFNYDEWDRELTDHRVGWCRVVEKKVKRGSRTFVDETRERYKGVMSSIRHQFQLLKPENLTRIVNELDGEDYDLNAVVDYFIDRRADGQASERIYTKRLRRRRDVAVSFLLDQSSSTARTIGRHPLQPYTHPGRRIIEIEKEGLVLMSEALEAVGDVYSINGFTSEGRRNVKFYVLKDFDEHYSDEVMRRIGGITYQNNTRLGAAIRHATAKLEQQEARTRLLIVLSDGRPYDHDYGDARYAREDTREALVNAKVRGITPFCITIDRESEAELRDLYGEVGYTIIDDVLSLPERLPGIYRRLTT